MLYYAVTNANKIGYAIGISGGIDSAVVAALCRKTGYKVLGVYMPCYSNEEDEIHAKLLCTSLNLNLIIINLDSSFDNICKHNRFTDMAKSNLKARLRMATLYAVAQSNDLLVTGTSNKTEYEIGYFTKWGDSASDIFPIIDLYKTEIRMLAKELNIPKEIIDKAPSAGLWERPNR